MLCVLPPLPSILCLSPFSPPFCCSPVPLPILVSSLSRMLCSRPSPHAVVSVPLPILCVRPSPHLSAVAPSHPFCVYRPLCPHLCVCPSSAHSSFPRSPFGGHLPSPYAVYRPLSPNLFLCGHPHLPIPSVFTLFLSPYSPISVSLPLQPILCVRSFSPILYLCVCPSPHSVCSVLLPFCVSFPLSILCVRTPLPMAVSIPLPILCVRPSPMLWSSLPIPHSVLSVPPPHLLSRPPRPHSVSDPLSHSSVSVPLPSPVSVVRTLSPFGVFSSALSPFSHVLFRPLPHAVVALSHSLWSVSSPHSVFCPSPHSDCVVLFPLPLLCVSIPSHPFCVSVPSHLCPSLSPFWVSSLSPFVWVLLSPPIRLCPSSPHAVSVPLSPSLCPSFSPSLCLSLSPVSTCVSLPPSPHSVSSLPLPLLCVRTSPILCVCLSRSPPHILCSLFRPLSPLCVRPSLHSVCLVPSHPSVLSIPPHSLKSVSALSPPILCVPYLSPFCVFFPPLPLPISVNLFLPPPFCVLHSPLPMLCPSLSPVGFPSVPLAHSLCPPPFRSILFVGLFVRPSPQFCVSSLSPWLFPFPLPSLCSPVPLRPYSVCPYLISSSHSLCRSLPLSHSCVSRPLHHLLFPIPLSGPPPHSVCLSRLPPFCVSPHPPFSVCFRPSRPMLFSVSSPKSCVHDPSLHLLCVSSPSPHSVSSSLPIPPLHVCPSLSPSCGFRPSPHAVSRLCVRPLPMLCPCPLPILVLSFPLPMLWSITSPQLCVVCVPSLPFCVSSPSPQSRWCPFPSPPFLWCPSFPLPPSVGSYPLPHAVS
ncbi:hypothetical protein FKM82_018124 [Ascaphus truei]